MQYIYYLSACNKDHFKSYYRCFIFAIRRILQILWKIFIITSLYILEKNFFVSKYGKQMSYKENKSLFYDVMKSGPIFPSKVCHFQCDRRFHFSRKMENIRTFVEVRLQKLIKYRFPVHYSFWHLSSCL